MISPSSAHAAMDLNRSAIYRAPRSHPPALSSVLVEDLPLLGLMVRVNEVPSSDELMHRRVDLPGVRRRALQPIARSPWLRRIDSCQAVAGFSIGLVTYC